MEELVNLLNRALAQTTFHTSQGAQLTSDELRESLANTSWGNPGRRPLRSASPQTQGESAKSIAELLRIDLADYVHADSDRIGHSFEVSGEIRGAVTATEDFVQHRSESSLDRFVQALIRAAAVLGAEQAARLIHGWSQGEPLRSKTCVMLGGGVDVDRTLRLEPGIRIFPLPLSSDTFPISIPEHPSLSEYSILGQVILEVDVSTRPPIFHPGDVDDEYPALDTRTTLGDVSLTSFFLALSLACNRQVGMAWQWTDWDDAQAFNAGISVTLMGPGPVQTNQIRGRRSRTISTNVTTLTRDSQPEPNLTAKELSRAREVSEKLHTRLNEDPRFRVGVTRWSQAALPGTVTADRLVDLRIALEALFIDSDSAELRFRLATTCARYLGETLEEKKRIYESVNGFYNVASQVIHGTEIADIRRADAVLIDEVSTHCRNGILKLLERHEQPKWTDIILG